jgi:hypothetical protein
MPEKETVERAQEDAREGKSPSTQAGEFVREEIEHVKQGRHGARSTKQAVAIGLSKARRAGVNLPPPETGSEEVRRHAERDYAKGQGAEKQTPSRTRSRAATAALQREGSRAVSHKALSAHGRSAGRSRTAEERSASARKAAQTRRKKHDG